MIYSDDWLTIYGGDCRTVLAELPDESVHCVVTSPPYWGLRDYGTTTWEGGEDGCDHTAIRRPGEGDKSFTNGGTSRDKPRSDCRLCGAVRIDSQLGLEPTPEQYVENMVAVFREVRRVLRSDGTVWLNLGDSYASTTSGTGARGGSYESERAQWQGKATRVEIPPGLKPKDLVGIPWRVAFALQADGWYLRSDIIWSKPNPMPESVTDRPTKSHEYVFLLSKSARYYFDADAVREPVTESSIERVKYSFDSARERRGQSHPVGNDTMRPDQLVPMAGRNIRTVWTVATQPYPGAHFAVFPEKLVEPCILAGTSERGVCPECGKPWRRVTETERIAPASPSGWREAAKRWDEGGRGSGDLNRTVSRTLSWIPSCAHDAEPVGAVVLDPFGGSGTTARVANRLSRRAILIDLNPEYLKQQMDRNRDIPLGLGAA